MAANGEDQSSLARAIGITQGAISKILQGKTANSRHLPRIAIHLGVSFAWLLGETDDAMDGATPPPAPSIQFVTVQVGLPSEAALARMFLGLLKVSKKAKSMDEQALLLARRLPNALSQLRDLLPDTVTPAQPSAARPQVLATPDHGRPR